MSYRAGDLALVLVLVFLLQGVWVPRWQIAQQFYSKLPHEDSEATGGAQRNQLFNVRAYPIVPVV